MNELQQRPPLTPQALVGYKEEYRKLGHGQGHFRKVDERTISLKLTATYISNLREEAEISGGWKTGAGELLHREANKLHTERTMMIGDANGLSRSEIQRSLMKDEFIVKAKELSISRGSL